MLISYMKLISSKRKLLLCSIAFSFWSLLSLKIHIIVSNVFSESQEIDDREYHDENLCYLRRYSTFQILVKNSTKSVSAEEKEFRSHKLFTEKVSGVVLEKSNKLLIPPPERRPWYLQDGRVRPTHGNNEELENKTARIARLFPKEYSNHDRITRQLNFLPSKSPSSNEVSPALKKILLWNGPELEEGFMEGVYGKVKGIHLLKGSEIFIKEKCPVKTCSISSRQEDALQADLVLFKDEFKRPNFNRPMNQIWLIYLQESPIYTQIINESVFNWTSTYRSDSTIVAPYGKWQYYNDQVRQLPVKQNYAENKTKSVAWVVSHCDTSNRRMEYAKELAKYIQVDIFGSCGNKRCSYSKTDNCFGSLAKEYRFYLAFENSNCKDYITEKFFYNALGHDMLPIVMGAHPKDYERLAPYKSYIHVDDFEEGPRQLANYLKKLEENDDLYNEYFKWKGTGEMINTKYFCRLCALLHEPNIAEIVPRSQLGNFNKWWNKNGTCIVGSWKERDSV